MAETEQARAQLAAEAGARGAELQQALERSARLERELGAAQEAQEEARSRSGADRQALEEARAELVERAQAVKEAAAQVAFLRDHVSETQELRVKERAGLEADKQRLEEKLRDSVAAAEERDVAQRGAEPCARPALSASHHAPAAGPLDPHTQRASRSWRGARRRAKTAPRRWRARRSASSPRWGPGARRRRPPGARLAPIPFTLSSPSPATWSSCTSSRS